MQEHPSIRATTKLTLRRCINRLGILKWAETLKYTKHELANMLSPHYCIVGNPHKTEHADVNPFLINYIRATEN